MSQSQPTAQVELFIRRPAAEVFQAFVDPTVTTKFWFTKSTGPLVAGAAVTWSWEMYGVSAPVRVRAIEPDRRIEIAWGEAAEETIVEWTFQDFAPAGTFVRVVNHGFSGAPESVLAQVADATQGFTFLLSGLKAWLEHGVQLNLVGDKFPAEVRQGV